jgi:uncharacterized membrane protein YbhN (UPF0104 family)
VSGAPLEESTRQPSGLRRLLSRSAIQTIYFVLLLALAAYYFVRWRGSLPALLDRLNWGLVAVSGLALVVATLFYVFVQYSVYRGMGVRLTFRQTFSIVCPSQLGKYVPGKVLLPGNYYLLSRKAGVDVREIGGSFLISTALWIVTAVLCSLSSVSLLSPTLRFGTLLLPVLLLVAIHPRVLSWVFGLLGRALRKVGKSATADRLGESLSLPYSFYLKILAMYLVAWLLVGVQVFCLIAALQPVGAEAFPISLAAGSIGTVIGFVALFAPGGLGIREGLGAVILAQITTPESALFVLVLLRLMTVIADLSFGGLGLWLGRQA